MERGSVRLSGKVVAAMALAAGVAGGCQAPRQAGPPTTATPVDSVPPLASGAPAEPGERRPVALSMLVRASSCESFVKEARRVAMATVGPYGFSGGYAYGAPATTMVAAAGQDRTVSGAAQDAASPKAGTDFSGTNVQEAGVDEPDTVKTDGRLLVTSVDGRLRVLDVSGAPRLVSTLDVPDGGRDLLLVGNRVLVLSGGGSQFGSDVRFGSGPRGIRRGSEAATGRPTTTVTVVDLTDPAKPSVARTHTIDGAYVDARLVGGVARIVTRSQPDIGFPQPTSTATEPFNEDAATKANQALISRTGSTAFLPRGASCENAYVPVDSAGVGTVAVQSLDPAADAPGPAVTVTADASTVYASAGRLFVATTRHADGPVPLVAPDTRYGRTPPAQVERTAIHAFDITDPAKARYAGSGDVPGHLLNQFSLSEHEGKLRVATTTSSSTASQSRVTILRPAGEEWVETGAVDGLGKGEQIYAVRFLGATGYVVTFRQVDPLYVLDLGDVRAPKITGELKITGYSAYLHPAGDGRLLGIGQEATDQGRRQGTQLSLFDVGDPAAPKKLAGAVLPTGSSAAEYDHHAFLFWPASGLVVAPVTSYGNGAASVQDPQPVRRPFVGAVAFKVGDKSVTEAARITHPGSTSIERSLVVGTRLLTVSPVGVATNDLATLADGGFLAFR